MAQTKSIQPRRQRLARYRAPLHVRRKQVASHLSDDLLRKYSRRSMPVVVGDEVKVLRGQFKGKKGDVVAVDTKHRRVTVEGVTHKKADGTDVALPIDPSNLVITKLHLEDKRRRDKLGETEAPPKKQPTKAKKAPAAAAQPSSEDEEE